MTQDWCSFLNAQLQSQRNKAAGPSNVERWKLISPITIGDRTDLKQFITETLVQVSAGIEAAQKQLKDSGAETIINTNMTVEDAGNVVTGGRRRPVEFVEFDVAILANEGTETKAGIGLTVASLLRLDAGGKSTESTGRESRIKFKIPMSYPMHKYTTKDAGDA